MALSKQEIATDVKMTYNMKGKVNGNEFTINGDGTGNPYEGKQKLTLRVTKGGPLPFAFDLLSAVFCYGNRCFTKYPDHIPDYFKQCFPGGYSWERKLEFEDGGSATNSKSGNKTGYPKKYPNEVLESLSPDVLSERLKKFYQELKKSPTEHYSTSAHLSIRAAIDRYLNTLPKFSSISIIRDPLFKIANKSLSAKLKQLKAQGFAKVQHHPSISPEDIQKCYETKVFCDETPISLLRVNWFKISLHFCRRGRENLRSLTPDSFVIKKDANDGEYVEMSTSEKTKNHQGGLGDKADESDPKMCSTGKSNCPGGWTWRVLQLRACRGSGERIPSLLREVFSAFFND